MTTTTIKKMGASKRQERATALREAAEEIESCWMADSMGAAKSFMRGDPAVADHLGSLNPPRWMAPLVHGDPQECVARLIRTAKTYEAN